MRSLSGCFAFAFSCVSFEGWRMNRQLCFVLFIPINWNLLVAIDFYGFADEIGCTISVLINVILKTFICNIHLTETC